MNQTPTSPIEREEIINYRAVPDDSMTKALVFWFGQYLETKEAHDIHLASIDWLRNYFNNKAI